MMPAEVCEGPPRMIAEAADVPLYLAAMRVGELHCQRARGRREAPKPLSGVRFRPEDLPPEGSRSRPGYVYVDGLELTHAEAERRARVRQE
jgi:hypothetical protein